jgi:hypothetical protein
MTRPKTDYSETKRLIYLGIKKNMCRKLNIEQRTKRTIYMGLKRAFCRVKFSPKELKIKKRMSIGLRNAFIIPSDPMVRARRIIYEGMKRRFKLSPLQRAKMLIYKGLKANMTRPKANISAFQNPDYKQALE